MLSCAPIPIFSIAATVSILWAGTLSSAAGDTAGETLLEQAFRLEAGEGMKRDITAAAALYQQAARSGDAFAQFRIGYLHEVGDGVDQDYAKARAYYEQATIADIPEAHLRLAICHLEGWGGPVDRPGFVRELTIAADADYAPAQRILASVYFTGFHVPEDRAAGIRWLERAALQDDAIAQYDLGKKSESIHSIAAKADLKLARTWYELSAEQEYLESMRAISRSFLSGPSADRNWTMAQEWLELADESGDAEAPYILASYALRYPDKLQDAAAQAKILLERASARGNYRASDVLAVAASQNLSLLEASSYVLRTPFEDRYMQNIARKMASMDEQADRPPQVVRVISPIFPPSLRLVNQTGEAKIKFVVDTTGRVTQPEVVSATHPLFGENAIEAVAQWRYIPGRRKGRLVKTRMAVPVFFRIAQERLRGADELFRLARDYATKIGGQTMIDVRDVRVAKPKGKLPAPKMRDGSPPPAGAQLMLLLVLDETGTPQRGHILRARPEELGPIMLRDAMAHRFEPRQSDQEAVAGSVLLTYHQKSASSNQTETLPDPR